MLNFYLVRLLFLVELPSKPELLEIFGRVLINSFNIMDDAYQPVGIGLYLSASVFDHSCNPNSTIVFNGKGTTTRLLLVKVLLRLSSIINTYIPP